mmetsp:Transcript_93330/g.301953  ORF Transcript_93330/g.301953 Transcript_93330/m.301953 type:complete len:810 (-) Transcript_93330:123-2552(-)
MFSPPSGGATSSGGPSIEQRGDNLAAKYSALAGDGAQGSKQREAAMLFSAGESSLNEAEDPGAALAKARQALALFREVGDRHAEADAVRLVLSAMAETESKESLQEALDLATKELETFRAANERRGEAAVLLSIAELTTNRFGSKKRDKAVEAARQARAIFAELKDAKLEGIALLAQVNALITQGTKHDSRADLETAVKLAGQAQALFRGAGQDQNAEAKALHSVATAHSYMDALDDAVRCGKQALALWRELGLKKFEGMELRCLAEWLLTQGKAEESLKMGEAALKVFEELGNGKGWEAAALGTVVRATLKLKDTDKALQLAKDGVRSFAGRSDESGEVQCWSWVVEVHLTKDEKDEALEAADKCLEVVRGISKRTDMHQRFEANMLHAVGQIHVAREDFPKALEACKAAVQIMRDLDDKPQQAVVLHTLSSANIGLKEFRDAVKAAIEARDIFRKRGHKRGHAYSCLACCHAYGARGETNRAISMAKEALKIFVEERNRKGEAEALGMLAEVYLARGTFPKAMGHAKEGRAVYAELGESLRELEMLFLISKAGFWAANEGGTPQKLNEKPSAAWEVSLQAAQEALSVSRRMGIEQSIVAALFSVGQIYVITRRPTDAAKIIEEALPMAKRVEDMRAEANIEILAAQMHIMTGKDNQAVEPATRALEIFKEKLGEKEGEDIAHELLRFVQGGGSGGAALQDEGGDEAAASQAGAVAEYQGPTVEDLVATITDVALSLMGVDELDGDTPLMDAGLDSLASVEFQNNLQKEFNGVQMPSTLVFDYPSVKTMSDFIHSGLREAAGFKAVAG